MLIDNDVLLWCLVVTAWTSSWTAGTLFRPVERLFLPFVRRDWLDELLSRPLWPASFAVIAVVSLQLS